VQDKTITEDTECWICRRKAKEVLDKVLDYYESGDEPFEDAGYAICMKTFTMGGVSVHVCLICANLIQGVLEEFLTQYLEIEDAKELVTRKDLENIRIVLKLGDAKS